jgi:hypothetical protein
VSDLDRIIAMGSRYAIQPGETRLTPFGVKLWRFACRVGLMVDYTFPPDCRPLSPWPVFK